MNIKLVMLEISYFALFFHFSQIGYLHVVIPPDIIGDETSGDMMVTEGTTVKLDCRARGYPTPKIEWRREDNKNIVLRDSQQTKKEGLFD